MVEVHNNPDKALSDSAQQLTPDNFIKMIDELELADEHLLNKSNEQIEYLRAKIDRLDSELISVLKERFNVVLDIGKIKKHEQFPAFQPKRFNELIQQRLYLADRATLNNDFIEELFRKIHFEALRIQNNITVKNGKKDCA